MMRILRRWRVCLYKKRKRVGKPSAPKTIYENALHRVGEKYPELRKDSFLWHRLRKVVGYVQVAHEQRNGVDHRLQLQPSVASSRLANLQRLYHLSDYEVDFVLACLLPELSRRFARIYMELQNGIGDAVCHVQVIEQILQHSPSEPALINESNRLFKRGILEWLQCGGEPNSDTTPIAVSEQVVGFLLGRYQADSRLDGILTKVDSPHGFEDLYVDPPLEDKLHQLAHYAAESRGTVFLFQGPYGTPRQIAAEAIASHVCRGILVVDVSTALRSETPWGTIVDLCLLAATSEGAVLYWRNFESLLQNSHQNELAHLSSRLQRTFGVNFLESIREWEPLGQFYETEFLRVDFPMPSYELQVDTWQRQLCRLQNLDPAIDNKTLSKQLAGGFQLSLGAIMDAINSANRLAVLHCPSRPVISQEDLREGCRRQAGRRLNDLAKHVAPRLPDPHDPPFANLVLPSASKKRLQELSQRVDQSTQVASAFGDRGLVGFRPGIVAMFTGPSGTGKTMAVEMLAAKHRKDLYKVDMSSVVSKYVGETEENLNKVFSEAEGSNSILFFDECESLFARRGEVRDPRDRWANMETNFLLQRIEEFDGVVIMATNLRQNIDDAFQRRIHLAVDFPFPGIDARLKILQILLPPEDAFYRPPEEELGAFARRFQISGGFIRNVVVDASFRALSEYESYRDRKPRLTLRHLVIAIGREYEKLGQPVNQPEFGPLFFQWYQEYLGQQDGRPTDLTAPASSV